MNKLRNWLIASITCVLLLAAGLPTVSAATFSDVKATNPHYKAVTSLSDQGIIRGYENGKFGVWNEMTRQQAAHIMVKEGKLKAPANPLEVLKPYKDVTKKNSAYLDIATVIQNGILKGSNGYFRPAANITREQAATMLVRGMRLDEIQSKKVTIHLSNVSPSHRTNVQVLANLGITKSLEDFSPAEPISRGAFATMLYKAQLAKKAGAQNGTSIRQAYEKRVVELTNKERTSRGLKALKADATLNKTAYAKSKDMLDKDYFDHNSPTYGSPFDLMKKYGVKEYKAAGENIALGYQTPEEVVDAWMKSTGHRKNILSKDYTQIGVGYEATGGYWTQHFIGK
ncbi:S-layer homology domain-containing protein [Aciduricibacillus chroicocephali]|uniref:S-layer homology domain-containing protein n=1 Tax=Aciduricibacillus chroicocephali TaxID=3054939 RepID=A0ABY9KUC4_9BACI|nr:S-layer homology domain-containing protein [Bacillaceae bacterium 44XB]